MNIAFYTRVVAGLKKSAALEKYLETHDDSDVLQTKTAHDQQLLAQIKEAGIGELAAKALQHPVGRGAAYGLGAAVPATAAGALLINQAGRESRETVEDARNKALQTALGVGGIGAGLMALNRYIKPTKQKHISYGRDATGRMVPISISMSKQSSDANDTLLIEKLATIGFLDTLLEEQEKNACEQVCADARECRMLNAEHGIDLLRQLLD